MPFFRFLLRSIAQIRTGGYADGKRQEGESTASDLKNYKATNSEVTNQFGGRKMIYKYEIACKEAGLSKEQITEIRKVFDVDRKRLKRETRTMEEENIQFGSVDDINGNYEEVDKRDIEDTNVNIELDYIKKWELEQLNRFLSELTEEEKEFLLAYYEDAKSSDSRIALKLGLPRTTVQSRRKKLLEKLRKRFDEEKIEIF